MKRHAATIRRSGDPAAVRPQGVRHTGDIRHVTESDLPDLDQFLSLGQIHEERLSQLQQAGIQRAFPPQGVAIAGQNGKVLAVHGQVTHWLSSSIRSFHIGFDHAPAVGDSRHALGRTDKNLEIGSNHGIRHGEGAGDRHIRVIKTGCAARKLR